MQFSEWTGRRLREAELIYWPNSGMDYCRAMGLDGGARLNDSDQSVPESPTVQATTLESVQQNRYSAVTSQCQCCVPLEADSRKTHRRLDRQTDFVVKLALQPRYADSAREWVGPD